MNTTDKTEKESAFEVTPTDYKEGLAKGWTDDDMLKPGIYKVRRATRFREKPEEIKVQIELEVFDFFRQRSDESLEKQINAELRKIMEAEKTQKEKLRRELLNDRTFIHELSEKLKAA